MISSDIRLQKIVSHMNSLGRNRPAIRAVGTAVHRALPNAGQMNSALRQTQWHNYTASSDGGELL